MKRKVGILVGVAVLGTVVYLGSRAVAQPGPGVPQPGFNTTAVTATGSQAKVALVNMFVIMKSYKKFDIYREEMMQLTKKYQEDNAEKQKNFDGWQKKLREAKNDQERDDAQKNMVAWKRLLEDATIAANKALAAKEDEKIVQMYREIQDAVKGYALSNGIQAVLTYTEPLNEAEVYSPPNIKRKLQASGQMGACNPIYLAQGIDVSYAVVNMLNSRYQPDAGAAAGGGALKQ